MPVSKNKRKSGGKKKEYRMANFPKPLSMQGVDTNIMQQVVNQYKGLAQAKDNELVTFGEQVRTDMQRLIKEVPGLEDRLRVSDDGYEVMEPDDDAD